MNTSPEHSGKGLTMERFSDKVVLVTGATGGIGSEICRRLAAEGAVVVVADLPGTDLNAAASHLPAGPHLTVELNVSVEDHWTAALERVTDAHGRLDAVVHEHHAALAIDQGRVAGQRAGEPVRRPIKLAVTDLALATDDGGLARMTTRRIG